MAADFRVLMVSACILCLAGCASVSSGNASAKPKIFDAHYHASWQLSDDAAARDERIAQMRAHNIVGTTLFITSRDDLDHWPSGLPGRVIAGPMMPCPPLTAEQLFCFDDAEGWPDLGWLESELQAGRIGLIGELPTTYFPIAPSDPRLDPYFALAIKYDVPVLSHTNAGPPPKLGPRRFEGCCPDFDGRMGDPDLWRPVLQKYPEMRLVLQHVGFPFPAAPGAENYLDATVQLLKDYPGVYADMSVLNALWDEESHMMGVQRFVEEGLIDRVMFATDNNDPAIIIDRLERLDVLTDAHRQGIYYDNAARFFRFER
ncbi:amidohydrolase family protein [Sphingomicrobium flavum]|uniref:amidohydrolase family protein n=1 Tax=Sphingomicrobium flavum TaxID=1229164 RepID=UPI0021AD655F|nr:amidohydrolase family protein [Sphingomicrobium flavum]